ncbi:MAG: LysM peptidoglycan-binding domain-containing protein [Candidatus Azobacteroides sp.]|nr:LysM peptidoglycan-binding domain-containing protein [Candidatus Azobacteroides sp.]
MNYSIRILLIFSFFITGLFFTFSQSTYQTVTENGKRYILYTVQPAEGLYSISRKFNVSQDEITNSNPEISQGLRVGQEIKIPLSGNNVTSGNNSSLQQTHVVAPGETLYSLSRLYDKSVDELISLNPELQNGLKVGQEIKISTSASDASTLPTSNRTHTVIPGETLYSLANAYGTTVEELIQLNPHVKDGLKTGQEIYLPREGNGFIYHTIQDKETLFSISKKYELSQEDILTDNPGLSASNLKVGSVIRLDAEKIRQKRIEREERERINNSYFTYIAEKKEKVEDVAERFNVSVNELKKINPKLPKKLSKGDKILIPAPKIHPVNTNPVVNQLPSLNEKEQNSIPKIAIMLPFLTNVEGRKAERDRMVEYYEGFLMALNEAKLKGFSVNLYTYDVQNNEQLLNLIGKPELKEMNLIIGPAYEEGIDLISEFSQNNHIPLVVPFTSRNSSYQTNPYIYQINAPQSFFQSKVSEVFIKQYKNYQIVILIAENIPDDKSEFIQNLTSVLEQEGIQYKKVSISGNNTSNLLNALSSEKKNVIVPAFSTSGALEKTLPGILKLKEGNPSKDFILFGYPEWQTYNKNIRLRYLHPLDSYIFSSFYASMSSFETNQFRTNFMKAYSKDIIPTFPKFALLGYDTGKYFLSALQKYGFNFYENSNSLYSPGLQMNFNFERTNYWSGFINKNIYFIHFDKEKNVSATNYR